MRVHWRCALELRRVDFHMGLVVGIVMRVVSTAHRDFSSFTEASDAIVSTSIWRRQSAAASLRDERSGTNLHYSGTLAFSDKAIKLCPTNVVRNTKRRDVVSLQLRCCV